MKRLLLLAVLPSLLAGCATCERHPYACGALTAVAATSIALSINHSTDSSSNPNFRTRPVVYNAAGAQ